MRSDPTATESNHVEIACQSCGAKLLVESHMLTAICPYCASSSIIQRPPSENLPTPSFAIGFAIDHERASRLVRNWLRKSHLFARSDFKKAAPELTRGVYLPIYLYGAVADSTYTARIGENYTETETYTTTDSNGRTVTRTRTVVKTEYRSLRGKHGCYILDVIVTASNGVANKALEAIEPFDLRMLRRFTPELISGWLAEEPSRSLDDCLQLARDEMKDKVGMMLRGFMPGDSHHDLQFNTEVSREVIDLALFPIWTFAVRYNADQTPIQILVNGQTGKVGGNVPISMTKVGIAIAVAVLLIVLFVVLFSLAN